MLRTAFALLLAGCALPLAAQEAPTRLFTGGDLFNLEQAADPQISPDGRAIAYVRRTGDIMADRMASAIWLIDTATGAPATEAPVSGAPATSLPATGGGLAGTDLTLPGATAPQGDAPATPPRADEPAAPATNP